MEAKVLERETAAGAAARDWRRAGEEDLGREDLRRRLIVFEVLVEKGNGKRKKEGKIKDEHSIASRRQTTTGTGRTKIDRRTRFERYGEVGSRWRERRGRKEETSGKLEAWGLLLHSLIREELRA